MFMRSYLICRQLNLFSDNSDLSLSIDKDSRLSAIPLCEGGFAYVWHGARANLGAKSGKIWYEIKITEQLNVAHLEATEQHPHVVRAGWSKDSTTMTLGEEKDSWGYGGTAKASTACKFKVILLYKYIKGNQTMDWT